MSDPRIHFEFSKRRTTNIGQLAGALLRRIQELDEAVLHVAGAERTMAALKAVITAQRLLEAEESFGFRG